MRTWIFSLLALLCLIHIYRDYLQLKGVKSWFTQIGHIWDAPQYEKHGMVVAAVLALIFGYLAISS